VTGGLPSTASYPGFFNRFYAFWHAVYLHFSLWVLVLLSLVMWCWKSEKNKPTKIFWFLSGLFFFLAPLHAYASIGGNYCIFCFENYTGFFAPAGYLLAAIAYPHWRGRLTKLGRTAGLLLIGLLSAGWGYASAPFTAPWLLNLPVPRVKELHILPGKAALWQLLSNRFGWSYEFQKMFIPTLSALVVGVLLFILTFAAAKIVANKVKKTQPDKLAFRLLLCAAVLATLLVQLDRTTYIAPCEQDVIESYRAAGAYLAQTLPEDALLYWEGVPIVELLYLPDVRIFPPQLNQRFSFVIGGSPEKLVRYGLWNDALAQQWMAAADYIIVDEASFTAPFADRIAAQSFSELPPSPPYSRCSEGARIRIFKRD